MSYSLFFRFSDDLRVKSEQTVYQAARKWFLLYRKKIADQCAQASSESLDQTESKSASASGVSDTSSPQQSPLQSSKEKCSSGRPCTSCRSVLSASAKLLLPCLRLPLCSANFLFDVVRLDRTFLNLDLPTEDASAPAPPVHKLHRAMYDEAISWQGFSKKRREAMKLSSTIRVIGIDGSIELVDPSLPDRQEQNRDKEDERKTPRPIRFCSRVGSSAPLSSEPVSISNAFGASDQLGSESARVFFDGNWRAMHWLIPDVGNMTFDNAVSSSLCPVDGYIFRLYARKSKRPPDVAEEGYCLAFRLGLDEEETGLSQDLGFFETIKYEIWCKDNRTSKLMRIQTETTSPDRTYYDSFKISWEQLMASDYVNSDGAVEITLKVKFDG